MAINRDRLKDLVEVFYQPPFKTFYVNSIDQENFCKPLGIFVSLGITTSMRVLSEIQGIIDGTDGYKACLAEISTTRIGSQFLNTLIETDDPKQYLLTEYPSGVMHKEDAEIELERMKSMMSVDQSLDILKEYAPKISKLQDLIKKLTDTNGWAEHVIQKESDTDYRIFHCYVNYKKEDNIEYRIGIYVSEDNC